MAKIQWIKISTDIFSNNKIKYIQKLPKGSEYVLLWFRLLTMAGICNDGGKLFLTEDIPYTDEILALETDTDADTVKEALKLFSSLKMIDRADGHIHIASWEEYQNIERLEIIKEQNRIRSSRYRQNKSRRDGDVTRHAQITQCHATDKEGEKEEDKDIKRECMREKASEENAFCGETDMSYASGVTEATSPEKNSTDISADTVSVTDKESNKSVGAPENRMNNGARHRYGLYKNVLLSDSEYEAVKNEFADYEEKIDRLSEYIESKGARYKSHIATIRAWARMDACRGKNENRTRDRPAACGKNFDGKYGDGYTEEATDNIRQSMSDSWALVEADTHNPV